MTFYPEDTQIPDKKVTDAFILRPLRETDAELDLNALMESKEQLRRWSQTNWPSDNFSLEDNQKDLRRHELEHEAREAFTYTVLSLDKSKCLGCVYIESLPKDALQYCEAAKHPAIVAFWVRSSELTNNLDEQLFLTLQEWLATDWLFDCVLFMVSQLAKRQIDLLNKSNLNKLGSVRLSGERLCWVFG